MNFNQLGFKGKAIRIIGYVLWVLTLPYRAIVSIIFINRYFDSHGWMKEPQSLHKYCEAMRKFSPADRLIHYSISNRDLYKK